MISGSSPSCCVPWPKGYTTPTPIQKQAIPAVLSGRDVLAGAQTGTGKTAGFVLPLLQKLVSAQGTAPARAGADADARARGADRRERARLRPPQEHCARQVIFGGVGERKQIDGLRAGCDILIATPGRLLDLCGQRECDLSEVQLLRARRGRPHARHGLHPRHQAGHRHAAEAAAEPDVLGHLLRRHPHPGGAHARQSGERGSGSRATRPPSGSSRSRSASTRKTSATCWSTCSRTGARKAPGIRCWCSREPSTAPIG
jgi:hypothetical protein